MFEDTLAPERNGRSRRERLISVLATLLFHGLLGLAVYYGRFTVKILPVDKREEVRDVVIVPPLTFAVPKVVGGRGLAAEPAEAPGRPGLRGGAAEAEAAQEEPARKPDEAAGGPPGGEGPAPPGAGAAIPSLSSRFRESLAIRGRS